MECGMNSVDLLRVNENEMKQKQKRKKKNEKMGSVEEWDVNTHN